MRKNLISALRERENETILQLNTLYPYGLNDRLEKPFYVDTEKEFLNGACVYKLFPKVTSTRTCRGNGKKHTPISSNNPVNGNSDISIIYDKLQELFVNGNLHACRTIVTKCNIDKITELGKYVKDKLSSTTTTARWCSYILLDLCRHYRNRNVGYNDFRRNNFSNKSKHDSENVEYVPIKFISKEVEEFNLSKILNDKDFFKLFPVKDLAKKFSKEDFKFNVCFKYGNSIRSSITNYRQEIVGDTFDKNPSCFCHLYPEYIDVKSGHVVTGNMDIIDNHKIRTLFKKGLKYIEPLYKNKAEIIHSLLADIKLYIKTLSTKYSVSIKYFIPWFNHVKEVVCDTVNNAKIYCKKAESTFDKYKDDLDKLKKHFIVTGVDKAPKNISLICKSYYIETMTNELVNTNTYTDTNLSESDIIRSNVNFSKKFNVSTDDLVLPFIHITPKFHKKNLDFRYIAAAKKSSLKLLSQIMSKILKLIDRTVMYSDRYQFNFKDASGYFIAKNKDKVISDLEYLNHTFYAKSVMSFDFKKLYTNLPHDKVIEKISDIIKRCYNEKKVEFINISKSLNASWSSKKSRNGWSFTYDDVIEIFKYLINNIYIKFRGRIYRQVIGIPMGSDCASQIADLFLYWYEHSFVSASLTDHPTVVRTLKYGSRYIDDLNVPNCSLTLENIICKDIYPNELEIVRTNDDSCYSPFLDLDIFVDGNKFGTKLYDKRRDFNFKVISFPNLKSCIPNNPSYGTFIGELHRLCKSCSSLDDFINEVKSLINKLVNQNFVKCKLIENLSRFLSNKPACLNKYWCKLSVNMFV